MTVPADDSDLMLRYRDGDLAAFEVLYRRHNDALYRYLLRLSADPDAAADIFQDAWSRIVRASARYRPTAKFSTFLYRVAHNCFIDYLRRNKRHGNVHETDPDTCAHPADEPPASAERSQSTQLFRAALDALPREQRDAFLLHEESGLTLEQIAEVSGTSRETIKSRLRYATDKLKKALASAHATTSNSLTGAAS